MPSLKVGLRTTAIYLAMIAIATIFNFVVLDPPHDTITKLQRLLPVQLVLVGLCLYVIRRHLTWRSVGFGRIRWRALLWLLPSIMLMVVMAWDLWPALSAPAFQVVSGVGIALLISVPLLVGFSEEVLFRGILLRGAMARLPVAHAMLLSAVLFALMHVLNGIVVQTIWPTLQQIAFALCVGFFLAPIALKIGNLWPLILWHGLWDMIVLASQIANTLHPIALIIILIQALICTWLWANLARLRPV